VQVASSAELLRQGKADVWDSGRVESGQAVNVRYAGPAVVASMRYFWRVKVWGAAGKVYADSEVNWWETGLLTQDAWRAQWIGYETPEEAAVRKAGAIWIANPDAKALDAEKKDEQHYAYRATATLEKPVVMLAPLEEEHREIFIEVYKLQPDRQLVTGIEVLSPSNKRHGTVVHTLAFGSSVGAKTASRTGP